LFLKGKNMKIVSSGIVNGKLLDKYGKKGKKQRFGMPTLSIPFEILDAPKGTKSFAVVFDDPDSVKVCGKIWIHWLVANLHKTNVDEDESENSFDFLQGKNSWNENCYGGPCPPDCPHNYRLTVYALSQNLDLTGNFSLELLKEQMSNKILDSATIYGEYSN
jgi:Raf kinase inhibitor-like YbhB/YbcL family protein